MNKGVAILLERRKTNHEEFGAMSRWTNLLTTHNVYLEAPERTVLRPRTFNKEVIKRVLTGSDLERKSGAISRAQLLKELLPGLNQLFGKEYAKYTEEIKDKYNE